MKMLMNKSKNSGDPMCSFGIMTLKNEIPYRKPILKDSCVFVNARGVL